jgi:Na+/melibiose symporter-like transporter
MDFTLDYSPDLASMWCCLAVASAFLIGAVVASRKRRMRGKRGMGILVGVLLAVAAIAFYLAYESYFQSRPRNLWY